MKIVLEKHNLPEIKKFFGLVSTTARRMGHDVIWWNGIFRNWPKRLAGASHPPPLADVGFVWNGLAAVNRKAIDVWEKRGMPVYHCELGWLPHWNTWQVDHRGVNAGASWAGHHVAFERKIHVKIKNQKEILVFLQHEVDSQIKFYSPWFETMAAALAHLIKCAPQRLVVRKHPLSKPSKAIINLVNGSKKCVWDTSRNMDEVLKRFDMVATVNSSAAIQALSKRKVVLCMGQAVYRKTGAVVCIDNDEARTRSDLSNIPHLPVWEEGIEAVCRHVLENQWTPPNLSGKLSGILVPKKQ